MATAEKILQLKQALQNTERELDITFERLDQVLGEEGQVTEQEEAETEKDITLQVDEVVADEKEMITEKKEAKDLKQVKETDEAIGDKPAAEAAEKARQETKEKEKVDVVDLKTAEEVRSEEKKEKKALKKKKLTIREMREKVKRARAICEAEATSGGSAYSGDNRDELNQIIAEIRGDNKLILEADEHMRELHNSIQGKKMKLRSIKGIKNSLSNNVRNAIRKAERKKAA